MPTLGPQFEGIQVPAKEVRKGDKLDSRGRATVHNTMNRDGKVTLAFRVTGTRSGSIRGHAEDEVVKVWRKKA